MTCLNCTNKHDENFCPNCGSPKKIKRIDKQYIIDEVGSILNFDKGIFYTTKELLLRPGKTVKEFILNDRNRLVKSIVFIIICSLIYTIVQQIFQRPFLEENKTVTPTHTTHHVAHRNVIFPPKLCSILSLLLHL